MIEAPSMATAPEISPTRFFFQSHVKEALLLIDDQKGCSMANMLAWLIKQHCEHEGMGWPPKGVSANKAKHASKTRVCWARTAEHG